MLLNSDAFDIKSYCQSDTVFGIYHTEQKLYNLYFLVNGIHGW